ncbi:hypothetical protein CRUP_004539, partial [Coryphaenoides rupestris]
KTLKPTSNDVHISFLPLAHMFERVVEGVVLIHGGRIGFFQGDIRLLMDDMKTLRPTVFPVCVKGPNVFQGYLRDPEKTAEALDQDGWLHMGDIGKWLPNGTLKLIDRKKNLFKLAQGEYIAPEKIENVYIRCDKVAQIFVHGDSLQACLVAIVVPDPDFLPGWAKQRGLEGSYTELCQNKDVKKGILDDMLRLGKEGGLKSFEQVRDIMLHAEMFTVQNGLLTPTLKAKRYELLRHFREHIDVLYAGIKI